MGGGSSSALSKLLAVARGLVGPLENAAASGTAHVRWVWLPSPGRVALQRSCALQPLQLFDSTIGLAMRPRRFDCSSCTRVARARDDLSRQLPPGSAGELHSRMDRGSGRPCKAPFVQSDASFVDRAEPVPATPACLRVAKRRVQLGPRRAVQFTRLLPALPLGAIDRCASERLRRSSPLHLSNI